MLFPPKDFFENFLQNFIFRDGSAEDRILNKVHFVTCIWFTSSPKIKMNYLGRLNGSWIPELGLEILGA